MTNKKIEKIKKEYLKLRKSGEDEIRQAEFSGIIYGYDLAQEEIINRINKLISFAELDEERWEELKQELLSQLDTVSNSKKREKK